MDNVTTNLQQEELNSELVNVNDICWTPGPDGQPILFVNAKAEKRTLQQSLENYEEKYRVTDATEDTKFNFALRIGNAKTFAIGDIQAVKAKPKSGKTLFMTIVTAAALGCTDFNIMPNMKNKVVYFDTEQNKRSTQLLLKRLCNLMKWKNTTEHEDVFRCYNFRESTSKTERMEAIENIIRNFKPTLVIIDGIADLVEDFNDNVEADRTIHELMKLSTTYNCAITNVIHENKGFDDHSMKGHVGSILLQKLCECYELRKYGDDTFVAVQTDTRDKPAQPVAFKIKELNDDIQLIPTETPQKQIREQVNVEDLCKEAFDEDDELSYKDLAKRIAEIREISDRQAKEYIKKAKEKSVIAATPNGTYTIKTNK